MTALKNSKLEADIAVVLLSLESLFFFDIKWTSKPSRLFNAKVVIKPERPSPTIQILCFFILKFSHFHKNGKKYVKRFDMNTNFLNSVTNFLKKRTIEFLGLILIFTSIGLAVAFTTYSPEDPSLVYGDRNFEIQNFFGIYGSSVADFLLQSFGLVSFLILINFFSWGINLLYKKEIKKIVI